MGRHYKPIAAEVIGKNVSNFMYREPGRFIDLRKDSEQEGESMNDAEKRRRELLEQTRSLYSDKRTVPAVHPRYGSAYRYLYGKSDDEISEDTKGGTFGIRLFLCALIFAAFLTVDKQKQEVFHMSSNEIVDEITKDLDIEAVWKAL